MSEERSTDPLKNVGQVRTDMHCHQCSKGFIGLLDYSVDGNHVLECPHCGHEHCRVIIGGKVTGDRWESRLQRANLKVDRRTWKHDSQPVTTTTATEFLRNLWLNRGDSQG